MRATKLETTVTETVLFSMRILNCCDTREQFCMQARGGGYAIPQLFERVFNFSVLICFWNEVTLKTAFHFSFLLCNRVTGCSSDYFKLTGSEFLTLVYRDLQLYPSKQFLTVPIRAAGNHTVLCFQNCYHLLP